MLACGASGKVLTIAAAAYGFKLFSDSQLPVVLLPFCTIVLTVLLICLRLQQQEIRRLRIETAQEKERVRQASFERDRAQQDLYQRLTEERALHKEKAQFQAQLAEYEKFAALAQLALGAAHEINNPLLGILSHLELELRAATDSEQRTEIEQCIIGTRRISATLRGLVDYARPGPSVLNKVNLRTLTGDALKFLESQPTARGRIFENRIPADLPRIYVDAGQLSQVLLNLLLNSVEATEPGGRITLSASALPQIEQIEIRVSDNGSGIPPEILSRVFEPFFTTKRGKGTGLGLSISQTYIRSHNGEIRAESVPGKGTTIILSLPLAQSKSEAELQETGMIA